GAPNVAAECRVVILNAWVAEGFDGELGAPASVSFPAPGDWLRLGAELQGGVDQHGSPRFYASGLIGPNILPAYRPAGLKLTATALFRLFHQGPLCRLFVIAAWPI